MEEINVICCSNCGNPVSYHSHDGMEDKKLIRYSCNNVLCENKNVCVTNDMSEDDVKTSTNFRLVTCAVFGDIYG